MPKKHDYPKGMLADFGNLLANAGFLVLRGNRSGCRSGFVRRRSSQKERRASHWLFHHTLLIRRIVQPPHEGTRYALEFAISARFSATQGESLPAIS